MLSHHHAYKEETEVPFPTESSGMGRTERHAESDAFEVEIDGRAVPAYAGESVAAVMMAAGMRIFTEPSRYNLVRTLFCGMGLCHQCLVTVDGVPHVRACMTRAEAGMRIGTMLVEAEGDETD